MRISTGRDAYIREFAAARASICESINVSVGKSISFCCRYECSPV